MKIIPTLGWRLAGNSGEAIDARLIPLLDAIATQASLAEAVIACGVSYRAAWGLLRDYERKFGVPLVRERYYLAVRAKDVVKPPFVHLIGALRGQVFTHVRRLPGYFTAGAGTISGLEALKTERETKSRRRDPR